MSETYCPLPFNHLYVSEKGEVKPCCVSKGFKTKPNVNTQNLDTIYNNKDFITLRQSLTSNKKPPICNVCWEQEAVNVKSHRLRHLEENSNSIDTDTVEVQFEDIDIRFSNICNLKCVMCSPESSHLHDNGVIVKIKDGFLDDLQERIDYFDKKMDELIKNDLSNQSVFLKKKGSGMLRGFELNENVSASDFASLAREKGLLLVGAAENTIRLLPPLNTSEAEINEAFNTLNQVILALKKKAD